MTEYPKGTLENLKVKWQKTSTFYYQNTKYQKAENIQSFFQRVYDGIEDKDILIVTHGGVSIPLYCFFKGKFQQQAS